MRKLPNEEWTDNFDDYADAWRDIARPIEKATGYTIYGFDPTMAFSDGANHVQMPLEFVKRLSKALKGVQNAID